METLTYHQVLNDLYEETGRNVLVHTTEGETEEAIPPDDKHPDELENQEEFQRAHGSHQEAALLTNGPNEYKDLTKLSVLYSKDVKIHVINIDSRFRYNDPKVQASTPTNFTFRFKDTIKNVISMKVSGLEVPNSMYVFHPTKQNISFDVEVNGEKHTVGVPPGNYEDVCSMLTIIQDNLNTRYPTSNFVVGVDDASAKLTISSSDVFSLTFNGLPTTSYANGIGHHLGFTNNSYQGLSSYSGEMLVNTIESNYIFLSLGPNYPVITHRYENTDLGVFAKILINVPKNSVIFDNGTNVITKEYFFRQPTNMTSIPVQLLDSYGEIVDLQGLNFSFTLEMTEVINHGLYKLFNEVSS
jgi:hypothetical protein